MLDFSGFLSAQRESGERLTPVKVTHPETFGSTAPGACRGPHEAGPGSFTGRDLTRSLHMRKCLSRMKTWTCAFRSSTAQQGVRPAQCNSRIRRDGCAFLSADRSSTDADDLKEILESNEI